MFIQSLAKEANVAYTENGAVTKASTLDAVLDLFAIGGSARKLPASEVERLVLRAYNTNKELALRTIFLIGDVRGGLGERKFFKTAMKILADYDKDVLAKVVKLVPEYTRWDNLYTLVGTKLESAVADIFRTEHIKCVESGKPSLMYKWLKSTNTSSKESVALGHWTAKTLGFKSTFVGTLAYQKMLSEARAALGDAVVERRMSKNDWDAVNYESVCSKALLRYSKAFKEHSPKAWEDYLGAVTKGEKKINVSVTFPHEIYHAIIDGNADMELAWKQFPCKIKEGERFIPVVDTSWSMSSSVDGKSSISVAEVARALGVYCSERLDGEFKDKVITFSRTAKFIDLSKCATIAEKEYEFERHQVAENTNIQSVFDLILGTAQKYNIPVDEMPTKILILSDMEFDSGADRLTNLDVIRAKYAQAGYPMPYIIYWNLQARSTQFPADKDDKGIALVSGYSPALFETVLSGEIVTPLDLMMKAIMKPRYDAISECLK